MAESIDATSEFDQVQQTFSDEGPPLLDFLKSIATGASAAASVSYLADGTMAGERGSSQATDPTAPLEPDSSDVAVYSGVNTFLDWLYTQQLQAATFPTYAELFPDEPAVAPGIDTSNPRTFTIETVGRPDYVVPVWSDASAWSGGDISTDPSMGTLSAPFAWTGSEYLSQLLSGGKHLLYDLVRRDLESHDFGVDDLDDGRLWDRAREREDRVMAAAVEGDTRLFAAGGFTQPTGAAAAALERRMSESRDKVLAANREIMIKKADLYLEAKKIAMANGLEVEKLTMNFYSTSAELLLKRLTQEIASTVAVAEFNIKRISLLVEKYKAYAQGFSAQVDGTKGIVEMYTAEVNAENVKASANKSIYEALAAKNKVVIDGFLAQLQGFQTVMDARVKYHGVLADVYKTQVSQANTIADVAKGAYDLLDKQQKNLIDFRVGKYNAEISHVKTKVDEILGFINAKIEQLKNSAQSQVTLATSAMSALNVNLGLSLSASASIGAQESHSYDSTKATSPGESKSTTIYESYDKTKSTIPGEQTSYNHNYSYKEY